LRSEDGTINLRQFGRNFFKIGFRSNVSRYSNCTHTVCTIELVHLRSIIPMDDPIKRDFQLSEFLQLFWQEAGLRRSIDKVYEIIVYALFSAIVSELELTVEVSMNPSKQPILQDFSDFATKVLSLELNRTSFKTAARLYRVGVTNAVDRGIDMWANFGFRDSGGFRVPLSYKSGFYEAIF
jgi:HaeII restriction endonuclease